MEKIINCQPIATFRQNKNFKDLIRRNMIQKEQFKKTKKDT